MLQPLFDPTVTQPDNTIAENTVKINKSWLLTSVHGYVSPPTTPSFLKGESFLNTITFKAPCFPSVFWRASVALQEDFWLLKNFFKGSFLYSVPCTWLRSGKFLLIILRWYYKRFYKFQFYNWFYIFRKWNKEQKSLLMSRKHRNPIFQSHHFTRK